MAASESFDRWRELDTGADSVVSSRRSKREVTPIKFNYKWERKYVQELSQGDGSHVQPCRCGIDRRLVCAGCLSGLRLVGEMPPGRLLPPPAASSTSTEQDASTSADLINNRLVLLLTVLCLIATFLGGVIFYRWKFHTQKITSRDMRGKERAGGSALLTGGHCPFESPSHPATLLSGLNVLRNKGHLLDITLITQGETFKAHKVVLASCSDYFRAMFTDPMLESRQSEVCLNGVSASGMRLLLEYAYTARLALTLANVQDVLSAASHIQVVAVVEACSNYLQSELDLDNCVDIAYIAETYSLGGLRTVVTRYMCSHLVELSHSPDLCRLHPAQLEYILGSDFPVDCPEAQVLDITLAWLRTATLSQPHRVMWTTRLLRKIQLSEVSCWEIERRVSRCEPLTARLMVAEAIRQRGVPTRSATLPPAPPLVNSRGMGQSIVKVGGFSIGGITNEITYLQGSGSCGKWRHLTSIPHVEQCNFGTAVLHNDLYVVGGCFNQSLQENIHPFGFRYSPRMDSWTTMAPMQRERCRFSLNVLSGSLIAVGGVSEGDGPVPECERYDPDSDSWERTAPLPRPSTLHAAATLGDHLYVSGGIDSDLALTTLTRYEEGSESWECLAPLLTPRADHTMLAINGYLYVCGGWLEDEITGNRVLVDSVDRYDPKEDRWSRVTRVPTPRYHAGIVALNHKIYFIGGFHFESDAMFDTATAVIETYDLERDSWSSEDRYPQDIWEHTCVTLYIPTCREDMEVMAAPA